MASSNTPGLFITGTDTGVGKTYVATRIAAALVQRGYRVGVYKPAASGCVRRGRQLLSEDAAALWEAAGKPGRLAAVCPQRFAAPLAPHLAARAVGRQIDRDLLRRGLDYWRRRSDVVLVEGAGGLMSPLSEADYVADLAAEFGLPLVVVVANQLGAINQTLQTLITAAAFRHGLTQDVEDWLSHTSPTRKRGKSGRVPRLRFGLVSGRAPSGLAVAGVVLNDVRPASAADISSGSNRAELEARCVPPILAHLPWQATDFADPVDWYALACRAHRGCLWRSATGAATGPAR
jgi:dethiobiotin synthetase